MTYKYFQFIMIFMSLLVLAACSPAPAAPTSQPPTAAALPTFTPAPPTVTPLPTAVPPLTPEGLLNMQFRLPYSQKTIQMKNGKYEAGSGADYLSAALADQIGDGDLNGDGNPDAVVITAENMGGSGSFETLVVVLNQDGKPVQAVTFQLGDRQQIKGLSIQDKLIVLDMVIHGPNDPMCCPSLPVTEKFILAKDLLIPTQFVSKTPDGKVRSITIETPVNGAQVDSPLHVKGSVTIAPFENTLVYRLLDEKGNKVGEGPISVKSSEMGGPGTFEADIDLANIASGQPFRLAILDLSAADGSVMAMDSVNLARK
jgi:hypothetical protein